jgi:hypothetical protein
VGLLKTWIQMAPDQMQQAFAKLFGTFGGSKPGDGADTAMGEAPLGLAKMSAGTDSASPTRPRVRRTAPICRMVLP